MNQAKQRGLVLGIGLPRTGTTSLSEAMELLEIRSSHFPFEFWSTGDFSKLDEFGFLCDTPVYALFEEIEERAGKCRFIHTTRSLDSWLRSMEWLLCEGRKIWPWRPEYDRFNEEYFGASSFDAGLYAVAYERHHTRVATYFSSRPDDLLNLDLTIKPDWKPLCDFLACEIPSQPFPKANETRKPGLLQQVAVRIDSASPMMARYLNGLHRRIERE